MVDPKDAGALGLTTASRICLCPVVTDPTGRSPPQLGWCDDDERTRASAKLGVRNIEASLPAPARPSGARGVPTKPRRCRLIVVVVDEFADLMLVAGQSRNSRATAGAILWPGPLRDPFDHGNAAALRRRHHRHHQGELPDPHQFQGRPRSSTAVPSSASRGAEQLLRDRAICSSRAAPIA